MQNNNDKDPIKEYLNSLGSISPNEQHYRKLAESIARNTKRELATRNRFNLSPIIKIAAISAAAVILFTFILPGPAKRQTTTQGLELKNPDQDTAAMLRDIYPPQICDKYMAIFGIDSNTDKPDNHPWPRQNIVTKSLSIEQLLTELAEND